MSASAIYILDLKGKILISRTYRDDIPLNAYEKFMPLINQLEDDEQPLLPLITTEDNIHFLYVRYSNVYIVAPTRNNSDPTSLFYFIYKIIDVFTEYFKELEEESVRDNFVIIYELLDEMMDYGYPQITETKILREYITQESFRLERSIPRPPIAVTNAVSWRPEGITYRKNEVFLDVVESVNLLVNSNGDVLRSEILGQVKMKSFLSGMPDVRLGLNDKVLFENSGRSPAKGKTIEMEDVKFHQCVRLARFDADRTISFIPPDGEFELMSYRLSTQVKPLIWCEAVIEIHNRSRVEYMIKARAQFKKRSTANNVEISIPVPEDADTPKFRATMGSVSYKPEKNAAIWKIRHFPGGSEFVMRAHFGLPSIESEDPLKRPPISVKFEIPYFTVSGIQVRYLKVVDKSGYQAFPWVRYISQNGDYFLRLPDATTTTKLAAMAPGKGY